MAITGTGYVKRAEFMLFADVSATETAEWELLGDKVEDMSITMNPNVSKVTDITGNTSATLDKYEPQTSVTPMRARRESKMFAIVYDIVKNEKTLSDVERNFLCVNVFDATTSGEPATTSYAAWAQKGIVAVQSYGGNTEGLDIPYDIHWTGEKTYGQFNPTTKVFTPDAA